MVAIVKKPNQIGKKRLGQALCEQYYGLIEAHGHDGGQDELRKLVHFMRKNGQIRERDISLRALAEGILGENFQQKLIRHAVGAYRGVFESQTAIDVSAFSNITGQLYVDRVLENYKNPAFVANTLATTIGVTNGNLGTHREPWLSRVMEEPSPIQPAGLYPMATFKEQYIDLPAVGKFGEQGGITLEMIVGDLTRQANTAFDDLGRKMGQFEERLGLVTICGLNVTKYGNGNTFKYMGTGYNTYQASLYDNVISAATVTDYSGIANIELKFAKMVDLASGDPIDVPIENRKLLCVPDKEWELRKVFNATDVLTGAFPTSGANFQTHSPNPLKGTYPMVPSIYLYHLLTDAAPNGLGLTASQAKEHLFYGAFNQAFVKREVEPAQVFQMPPMNEAEFNQDIMLRIKTRNWFAFGVEKPQLVVESYNTH